MISMFRSTFRSLRVELPPEQFDFTTNREGKLVKHKPLRFEDGAFQTENEKVVHFLRNHKGNKGIGGSDFWELSESETRAVLGIFGPSAIKPEKSLTTDQKETLLSLVRLTNTPNGKVNIAEACDKISRVLSLYQVSGIAYPLNTVDMKARSVKALAIQVLDLFENSELLTEAEIKGFENGDRQENIGGVSSSS